MNRYAIWGVNAALFVLCCFLLAGVIAEVGAARLPPASEAAVPPASAPDTLRIRPDHGRILARNLFESAELAPEIPEAIVEETITETKLPLKLLGTAASDDPALAWAAVEDLELRRHKVVATGSEVRPDAVVVRIERKRVVFRNAGKLEELNLDEDATTARVAGQPPTRPLRPTPQTAAAQPPTPVAPAPPAADRRLDVTPSNAQEAARNTAALFSEARILPKYEEGAMIGMQLNAIQEGSRFSKAGLEDGDTIVQFNGKSLASPADSAEFLQQLMAGGGLEVLVRGEDGSERTLSFHANP